MEHGGVVHPHLVICTSTTMTDPHKGAGLCVHPNLRFSRSPTPQPNKEEELIVVPQHLLITPSLAVRKCKTAAAVLRAWHLDQSPEIDPAYSHRKLTEIILALFLLEEEAKGSSSPFAPYLAALPSRHELRQRLPVLWTVEEQTVSLGGSHMVDVLSTLRSNMVASYNNTVCPVAPEFCDRFSLEVDFLWALSIVQSRAFSLGDHDTLTLVPFGDMINHETKASGPDIVYRERFLSETHVTSGKGGALSGGNLTFFNRISLLQRDSGSPQLFLHYGSMDAAKTFSVFGFVDRVSVWRATIVFDEGHAAAAAAVAAQRGTIRDGDGIRHAFQLTTEVDDQAMDMVRYLSGVIKNDTLAYGSTQIARVLERLVTVVTEHLKYVTISDADAVEIEGASTVYRHALRYRRGEAHVLLYWRNLAKSGLDLFEERRRGDAGPRARVALEVGSSAYLHHGDFHLVRVVAVRSDSEKATESGVDVHGNTLSSKNVYDVRFFPSGTKVVGVRREDLLDEASLLVYLISAV